MITRPRRFRITDNAASDEAAPYVLIDDTDTVVRVGDRPHWLASIAFDVLGADEVIHDQDLVKAEEYAERSR